MKNALSYFACSSPMQLPVAEAMVTYKEEKSSGEESSQVFLPFLSDVKVGSDVISGNFSVLVFLRIRSLKNLSSFEN